MDNLNLTAGLSSLLNIFIILCCIAGSWWMLQEVRFDVFLRNPRSPASRMLQMVLSVVLGYGAARFIIDYLQWATALKWLF